MNRLGQTYATEIKVKIRSLGGNALTDSAPLSDDTVPDAGASKANAEAAAQAEKVAAQKNLPLQRILLCEALLAIGNVAPAFYMLSRWPVMAQYYTPIAELILRIVSYCLEPAYALISRDSQGPTSAIPYRAHFGFSNQTIVRTLMAPMPVDTEKRKHRYFYSRWTENLRRWESIEEVPKKVWPFMKILGAMAALNVTVLVQLCRIAVKHLQSSVSRFSWAALCAFAADFKLNRITTAYTRDGDSMAPNHQSVIVTIDAAIES